MVGVLDVRQFDQRDGIVAAVGDKKFAAVTTQDERVRRAPERQNRIGPDGDCSRTVRVAVLMIVTVSNSHWRRKA